MSIGIAILGAGIFARNEHLPAVQACSRLSLKAVYSRTKTSADKLAKIANKPVECYYDSPTSRRSLANLLDREDIHAVILALPIIVQPDVIKKAITAGKHVLSERPIAKDVKAASDLVKWYRYKDREEIWSVGEDFRFMLAMAYGAEQVKEIGGNVVTFSVRFNGFIEENDKFYQTKCKRQSSQHQGGSLLDEGIHFVAGLRFLLAAASESITQISAFTSLLQNHLAPIDTVHATMQISNGKNGTLCVSFGAQFKSDFEIQVVTDRCSVTVMPSKVVVLSKFVNQKKEEIVEFNFSSGVKLEVAAFAESIQAGKPDSRGTPEQAFMDLKVLQTMLESGDEKGAVKPI